MNADNWKQKHAELSKDFDKLKYIVSTYHKVEVSDNFRILTFMHIFITSTSRKGSPQVDENFNMGSF